MSQVTLYECDWCGHRGESQGTLKKVRIPAQYVPDSLQHVDSGADRLFDTCQQCGDDLADVFDAFADRRKLQRRLEAEPAGGA